MHKGLFWAQLIMGIGIGLIIASLIWIFIPEVSPFKVGTDNVNDMENQSYQNNSLIASSMVEPSVSNSYDFNFQVPKLMFPLTENNTKEDNSVKSILQLEGGLEEGLAGVRLQANLDLKDYTEQPQTTEFFAENQVEMELFEFIVEPGDSADVIASKLKGQGFIENEEEFLKIVLMKRLDRKLRAGSYLLPKDIDMTEFVNQLIK